MNFRNRKLFILSISLNVLLLVGLLTIVFTNRSKIFDIIASFKTYRIVMLGDSHTSRGKWNYDLNRTDIKNSGTGGITTSYFVGLIKKQLKTQKPEIYFIQGGTNDIGSGIPLNRTYLNFESVVDTLLKYNIEPVLQSTPYVNQPGDSIINSKIDSLNIFLDKLATGKNIIFIDLNSYISEHKRLKSKYTLDGVHLNEKGYKIWIDQIKLILKQKGI